MYGRDRTYFLALFVGNIFFEDPLGYQLCSVGCHDGRNVSEVEKQVGDVRAGRSTQKYIKRFKRLGLGQVTKATQSGFMSPSFALMEDC
jgi:hypothetical protein